MIPSVSPNSLIRRTSPSTMLWGLRRSPLTVISRHVSEPTRRTRANFLASSARSTGVNGTKRKHAAGSKVKQAIGLDAPTPNVLKDLLGRYRLVVTSLPVRFEKGPVHSNKLKTKEALENEGQDALSKQRKARIGLRLYDTLTAEELAEMYPGLTNFDIRQELPAQEHDTIPQAQELAKNDSQWEIQTQTRHLETGRDRVNAAVGKRLHKVYRFESWTMATKHFWKRINEYFQEQDVSVSEFPPGWC